MKNFGFEFKEGFLISANAIRANKMRSILTTLGIIIGVFAVVVMSTAIKGINNAFNKGISSMGSDNLYVDKWEWFTHNEYWKMRNRKNLTIEDYRKFKSMAQLPAAVSADTWVTKTLKNEDIQTESIVVRGVADDYVNTTNYTFAEGRFLNNMETNAGRNIVVLGYDVKENLFPRESAINRIIKIGGYNFRVVGVMDKLGSNMMGSFNPDKIVLVPITCLFKYFQGEDARTVTVNIRCVNTSMIDKTRDEAEDIMRRVRGLKFNQDDDFSINEQASLKNMYEQQTGVLKIAGFFITGLSLFVGAIGIMNIMFVSVRERTKEIGVRKAIGAKRMTILKQFIIEAILICLAGGFIGLMLAVAASKYLDAHVMPTSVQLDAVVLAFVVSLLTGVVSGFAPAYKAAKLDPVEALRFE
jgi:putative ABC transport system permease protein